jgi:hypothetical protein
MRRSTGLLVVGGLMAALSGCVRGCGSAEACDDGNFCTDDFFANGACQHTPVGSYGLYAAQGGDSIASSHLYRVSSTDAQVTHDLGDMGVALTGMAQHPITGVVYGVTSGQSNSPRSLVTVNLSSGATTVIAELRRPGPGSLVTVAELEFDSDGTLYGWCESGDDLCSINLETGETVNAADSGVNSFGDAMAFTDTGRFIIFPRGDDGEAYEIDKTTGVVNGLGTLTSPLTDNCGTGSGLSAGAFDLLETKEFYASRIDFCDAAPYSSDLLTYNLNNGVGTKIGDLPAQIDAIAFACIP